MSYLYVALLSTYCFILVYGENITLSIADGKILGKISTTVKYNVTFYSFRGIPFAKPPLGNLRFASPEKNYPWNGTWDATLDKNQCPQFVGDGVTDLVGDEDCLYLNVYTPQAQPKNFAENLPVLFWIYGGSFTTGNNSYSSFGPDYFLEENLIVVTINYRLGVLGFLSTEDAACPGNWGIKDQILALKWVQENIIYFGGNPKNVTIFGQSAGSASAHLLLQTPLTTGLFKGAILNSGTTLNLWTLNTRAKEAALSTGNALGIFSTNTSTLIAKLREVDVESLLVKSVLVAETLYLENGLRGLPFGLVMEPNEEGSVYIAPTQSMIQSGNFAEVPILMGFNSQELVAIGGLSELLRLYFLSYDLDVANLTPWSLTQNYLKRLAIGADIKNHYFQLNSMVTDQQGLINFLSADQFCRPIRKAAADMVKFTTVYFYQFGYEGNVSASWADRNFSGTGHAEDTAYLFSGFYSEYSKSDVKVSETMVLLWSNFAKFGNPTPYKDDKLNSTIWMPVDANSTDFKYLVLNETLSMSTNPKQSDWEYYTELWQNYGEESLLSTY